MAATITIDTLNAALARFKRPGGCTVAELAESMNVARATAYEYVRLIKGFGVEFTVTKEPNGGRGAPRKRLSVHTDLRLFANE